MGVEPVTISGGKLDMISGGERWVSHSQWRWALSQSRSVEASVESVTISGGERWISHDQFRRALSQSRSVEVSVPQAYITTVFPANFKWKLYVHNTERGNQLQPHHKPETSRPGGVGKQWPTAIEWPCYHGTWLWEWPCSITTHAQIKVTTPESEYSWCTLTITMATIPAIT